MKKYSQIFRYIPTIFFFLVIVLSTKVVIYFPESVRWFLFIGVFICLVIFAFHFPFYSFLLFIISLPLEAAFVFEVGFTVRLSYILLAVTIFTLFFSKKKFYIHSPLNLLIFIFLGVAVFSLIMTIISPPPEVELAEVMEYRGSKFRSIIQLFLLFFFASSYFLTLHFCSDEKKLNKALKTYIFVASVISLYGIYQFFAVYFDLPFVDITTALSTAGLGYGVRHYDEPSLFRSHATFQEPLNFGNYILSIFPFSIAIYFFKSNQKSSSIVSVKPSLFMIFIFVISLLLTKSRGAWAGFIVAVGLMFFLLDIKYKFKIIIMSILILIFLNFFLLLFISEHYKNIWEFVTFRFRREVLSREPRLNSLTFLLDTWKQYPIFGVGIGNYGFYAAQYFDSPLIVSGVGTWLQNLVEKGTLGFLSFILLILAFYVLFIRILKKTKRTPWYFYIVGLLCSFTAMIVQYLFSFDRFPLYFWVFLGISMAIFRLIKNRELRPSIKKS